MSQSHLHSSSEASPLPDYHMHGPHSSCMCGSMTKEHTDYYLQATGLKATQPQHTGHHDRMLGGKPLVEYVRHTVEDEARHYNVPIPSDKQIALVISALRMHTIVVHAAGYDRSELGEPNKVTEYWPTESSIGRYFRDAARVTLDRREEPQE